THTPPQALAPAASFHTRFFCSTLIAKMHGQRVRFLEARIELLSDAQCCRLGSRLRACYAELMVPLGRTRLLAAAAALVGWAGLVLQLLLMLQSMALAPALWRYFS